ncbi:hypothetical protein BS78_05G271600 [Paspalum vaginatum]|uniref:Uncharacterized protein n=1 Tax=Paspalum vaginatum TaxID=158149 RepID=A0A9W7X991_9POAL|nr:hypothetical protein BS78_K080800 [Paspalum vaginatum]KAJ1277138.1 hypothetical protein BS78_05G271600 [Paspalum vaginatum]
MCPCGEAAGSVELGTGPVHVRCGHCPPPLLPSRWRQRTAVAAFWHWRQGQAKQAAWRPCVARD